MARAYVPIYFEWREPLSLLSDAECGRLLRSLLAYGETGATEELSGNERFLFALMKQKIDRDAKAYEDKCHRMSENRKAANRSDTKKTNQTDLLQINETDNKSDVTITKTITKTKTINSNPLTPFLGELAGYSDEFIAAINDWIAYKTEKRQNYKPTGLKSLITQIRNAASEHGEKAVIEIIRASMAANYQGIVFDRLNTRQIRRTSKEAQPIKDAKVTNDDIERMRALIKSMNGE